MKILSKSDQVKLSNIILDKEDITFPEFIYAMDVVDSCDSRLKKIKNHARSYINSIDSFRKHKAIKPDMRDIDKLVVLKNNIGNMDDEYNFNKCIADEIKNMELKFKK